MMLPPPGGPLRGANRRRLGNRHRGRSRASPALSVVAVMPARRMWLRARWLGPAGRTACSCCSRQATTSRRRCCGCDCSLRATPAGGAHC
eukprot:5984697-Prymnesium_polylepis.1